MKSVRDDQKLAIRFIAPTVLVVFGLVLLPLLYTAYLGLGSLAALTASSETVRALVELSVWSTIFAALSTVLTFGIGMSLAAILQWPHLRFPKLYQTVLILPYAVPGFILILIFRGLFHQDFGELTLVLDAVFGVSPQWLSDPNLARPLMLGVNIWLGYPFMLLLGIAYLQRVPDDHVRAAVIEGAKPVRCFFSVTLPHILPSFVPLLIASFAFNFNNLTLAILLSDRLQNPSGHDLLASHAFRQSFISSNQNLGLAAAVTTLIFGGGALLSCLRVWSARSALGSERFQS
jgi:maltose/maltodextrin transport system permease protein